MTDAPIATWDDNTDNEIVDDGVGATDAAENDDGSTTGLGSTVFVDIGSGGVDVNCADCVEMPLGREVVGTRVGEGIGADWVDICDGCTLEVVASGKPITTNEETITEKYNGNTTLVWIQYYNHLFRSSAVITLYFKIDESLILLFYMCYMDIIYM